LTYQTLTSYKSTYNTTKRHVILCTGVRATVCSHTCHHTCYHAWNSDE